MKIRFKGKQYCQWQIVFDEISDAPIRICKVGIAYLQVVTKIISCESMNCRLFVCKQRANFHESFFYLLICLNSPIIDNNIKIYTASMFYIKTFQIKYFLQIWTAKRVRGILAAIIIYGYCTAFFPASGKVYQVSYVRNFIFNPQKWKYFDFRWANGLLW